MDGARKGISGWIECFSSSKLAGTVLGRGADGPQTLHMADYAGMEKGADLGTVLPQNNDSC